MFTQKAVMLKAKRLFLFLLLLTGTAVAQQPLAVLHNRLKAESGPAKINTYIEISKFYATDQPDSAVHYCNQAMRLAESQGDRHSQGLLLIELGRINTLHHHDE